VLETARFFSDYRLKKILKSINNSKFKSSQNYTCEFILFDGEDYGLGTENMFYGSRYLANNYELENIEFLILFDMVGDSDLQFYYELNSLDSAPKILKAIFESASEIGYSDFFIPKKKYRIFDDHLPFIEKGVKAVNIIDFDYPFWHTLQDDVSKTDALSLEVTGRSVLYYLLKNYKFDIQ
jgi:Zn-dependent M28 family amino/carboxypeptidase